MFGFVLFLNLGCLFALDQQRPCSEGIYKDKQNCIISYPEHNTFKHAVYAIWLR